MTGYDIFSNKINIFFIFLNIFIYNFFSYHQKIPYDPPELELKATYGLVAPEDYTIPPHAPLWTPVTYAAFDLTKNNADDPASKSVSLSSL